MPAPDARPDAPPGAPPDARPTEPVCEETDENRTAPPFPPPTVTTSGLLIRVMNNCPFPLWIHGRGGSNVLQPDDAQLSSGQTRDYDAGAAFLSARVTAFGRGPRQVERQFVEMHFENGVLGYNISYVDFLGLPVEVTADCGTTACYAPVATILDGCPAHLRDGDFCRSASAYCSAPPRHGEAYCKALDQVAQDALATQRCRDDLARWRATHPGAPIGTTPSVYACSDFWASSAHCCAIANRGVVGAANPGDPCAFYLDGAYNTYARWVHERCPQIYAFPYDDSADQGGFRQCPTRELRITWCPGG